uniref:Succinate dehydrogenase assembly factor 3 n=1 Tax=Lygus hesperus TaxID=30085 RepID=A0A0A9YDQ3_LYGHE
MIGDPHVRRVRYLYKVILRLHRGLPEDLNKLGTAYMKDEFKRHKTCDVVTASKFLSGWTDYAIGLTKQLGITGLKSGTKLGQPLGPDDIDHFNAEQVAQLYELKKVTHGVPD